MSCDLYVFLDHLSLSCVVLGFLYAYHSSYCTSWALFLFHDTEIEPAELDLETICAHLACVHVTPTYVATLPTLWFPYLMFLQ